VRAGIETGLHRASPSQSPIVGSGAWYQVAASDPRGGPAPAGAGIILPILPTPLCVGSMGARVGSMGAGGGFGRPDRDPGASNTHQYNHASLLAAWPEDGVTAEGPEWVGEGGPLRPAVFGRRPRGALRRLIPALGRIRPAGNDRRAAASGPRPPPGRCNVPDGTQAAELAWGKGVGRFTGRVRQGGGWSPKPRAGKISRIRSGDTTPSSSK
jgi:hypothetical protein